MTLHDKVAHLNVEVEVKKNPSIPWKLTHDTYQKDILSKILMYELTTPKPQERKVELQVVTILCQQHMFQLKAKKAATSSTDLFSAALHWCTTRTHLGRE